MSAKPSFLSELKRRNVLRAAALYAGAVWAFGQGLSQFSPALGLPDYVTRWFLTACAIGFPFWLAFAWFYEWTPQGLRRESEVAADTSITRSTGRKLDRAIIAVLVLAVVLLLTNTFVWRKGAGLSGAIAAIPQKSVAVLPLANLSGDPKQAYFSDGITVEILNALAQIPKLKVAGRTSAFTFRDKQDNTREIGKVLGVATVLEGSVQKAGDEVRITVQLVDTRNGYQLWSENYDRKLTNIFVIEDEISNAVANKLRVQWGGGASRPLVAQKTIDPRAHDFYLRGLTLLAARGPGLHGAVVAFQNAVKIAPGYAQAWGALADAEVLLPSYGLADISTAQARATSFAQHALALDANTASAYGTLGIVYLRRWQWAKADTAFHRSLALAPSDAEATDQYAQFLYVCGQFTPALAEMERAQRLDPLSAIIATMHAGILFALHRNAEADAQIRRALIINPDFRLAHTIAAMTDGQAGRFPQALAHAKSGLNPTAAMILTVHGMADPGLRGNAVQELETAPSFATLRSAPFAFAQMLALLGARDRALGALENLAADRSTPEPMQIWSPALDSVRNDPRFKAVLKQMGLPYTPKGTGAP